MKNCKTYIYPLWILLLFTAIFYGAGPRTYAQGAGESLESLPDPLKGLDIRDDYIASSFKRVGVIHALKGRVVVMHRSTKDAFFGKEGDYIHENDSLNTLADSRCRIRFFNEDVITMAPRTDFSVDSYEDLAKEGKKSSLFSLIKGKAMFYAMRLFKYKDSKFRVKTPTAVVGVRGTKFGVHVFEETQGMASAGVKVADTGGEIAPFLAQAGGGGGGNIIVTIVATGDGQLTANDQILNPGDVYDTRTNLVTFDPAVLDAIETDARVEVEVGAPVTEGEEEAAGEEEETTAEEEEAILIEEGESDLQETLSEQTEILQETVQQETGASTEAGTADNPNDRFTDLFPSAEGYFSALLTKHASSILYDVFVPTTRQGLTTGTVRGFGVANPSDYAIYDDTTNPGYIREVSIQATTAAVNVPIENAFVVSGQETYYLWGYWTGNTTMFTVASIPYSVDNKLWFIGGTATDTATQWPSGFYDYSLDILGTYWSETGGIDLSGTGSGGVSFSSGSGGDLYDFELEALSVDGLYGAKIKQGPDRLSFTGNQFSFDQSQLDSEWSLREGTTTWEPVVYGRVSGSFFGSDADMGVSWGLLCAGTGVGAGGIGHGPGTLASPPGAPLHGYFSSLLRANYPSMSEYWVQEVFVTQNDQGGPNDLSSDPSLANGIVEPTDQLKWQGSPYSEDGEFLEVGLNGTPYTPSPAISTTTHDVGFNPWARWGYWDQTGSFTDGSSTYDFFGRSWWIEGNRTVDSYIAGLTGTANFSGDAYGTYAYSSDGSSLTYTNLTGTIACDINYSLSSGQISDFDMTVTGGNYGARIQDGTGSLGSADFELDNSVGDWQLTHDGGSNWVNGNYKEAHGTHFGSTARAIGGAWGIKIDSYEAAHGIFQATK